jgi:hypothetical protein
MMSLGVIHYEDVAAAQLGQQTLVEPADETIGIRVSNNVL